MTPGTVTIHLIQTEPISKDSGWLLLSPAERIRATSFVFQKHADHWIACRAALRRILGDVIHVPPGEVPLVITDLGKPALSEPFDYLNFNLTHCEDLALLALCLDGPVGVDVEPSRRAEELVGCETSFCHPAEINDLPAPPLERCQRLLEIWTAKEALLKALGTGFSHAPETVRIQIGPTFSTATAETLLPGIENQTIHRLNHPDLAGHRAALSSPASTSRIEFHPLAASTSGDFPVITVVPPAKTDG